jgi:hypothetical protein
MGSSLVIGVDFDNTLVIYDELLAAIAVEWGMIGDGTARGKRQIRDVIRRLPDGELHWQRLQAAAYGPRIREAHLADGVPEFFRRCHRAGAKVYAISHKTELAACDETGTNLRQAALDWMATNGFFGARGLGLAREAVYFGATRQEKINYIRTLGCTHFIDDLEETFLEASFPAGVERILFAPHPPPSPTPGVVVAESWKTIGEHIFGQR